LRKGFKQNQYPTIRIFKTSNIKTSFVTCSKLVLLKFCSFVATRHYVFSFEQQTLCSCYLVFCILKQAKFLNFLFCLLSKGHSRRALSLLLESSTIQGKLKKFPHFALKVNLKFLNFDCVFCFLEAWSLNVGFSVFNNMFCMLKYTIFVFDG
jgi:hypothetical protein